VAGSGLSLITGSVSGSYVTGGVTTPLTVSSGNSAGNTVASLTVASGSYLYRYSGNLTASYAVRVWGQFRPAFR